jgi:hypothetical protein
MAAFWVVFTFGGSGPALTAHGSLDLKQEIQIQIQIASKCTIITLKSQTVKVSYLLCFSLSSKKTLTHFLVF